MTISTTSTGGSSFIITTTSDFISPAISYSSTARVEDKPNGERGIHPTLYFKYVKSKFKFFEKRRLDKILKTIEAAYRKALENEQAALGEKIQRELAKITREMAFYAKGVKYFIEKQDLHKHKRKIRGGHISDTKYEDYTRVIPPEIVKRKKELNDFFDGFVIYHYWNEAAEDDTMEMTPEEKSKMRDPVLFGTIKETERLYFIADWEDEYCDLTFEEMLDHLGKSEEDCKLSREITVKDLLGEKS